MNPEPCCPDPVKVNLYVDQSDARGLMTDPFDPNIFAVTHLRGIILFFVISKLRDRWEDDGIKYLKDNLAHIA